VDKQAAFYALDFDGVICDSAIETGITGWQAARALWDDMPEHAPDAIINAFLQARPIIETGYEAILTVRLLYLQESLDSICSNRGESFTKLMQSRGLTIEQLKTLFGQTRDAWIARDPIHWTTINRLYKGIAEKLQHLDPQTPWYIVTTKQERFVKIILDAHGIALPESAIYGLDCNLSKAQVLEQLLIRHPHCACHFVEDRLPTLLAIKDNTALTKVNLMFALWGYNTPEDKEQARRQGLRCIALDDFLATTANAKP